jgi:membrane protein
MFRRTNAIEARGARKTNSLRAIHLEPTTRTPSYTTLGWTFEARAGAARQAVDGKRRLSGRYKIGFLVLQHQYRGRPGNESPPVWAIVVAALSLLVPPRADRHKGAGLAPARRDDAVSGTAEEVRGRDANAPSDIPPMGWKDILWRIYHNIPEHRIISIAAGVTFFVLLSIFPGIAALVAIYGLFADPSSIGQHLNDLSGVLPSGATEVIGDQLTRLTSQPRSQLGFALVFGVAVSLWSANAGMKALFDALNVVYGEKEQRGFFRLNIVSRAFTLGVLIFMMVAVSAIAILPLALGYLGLSGAVEWLVALGKWPLLVVTMAFGIALIYRYGPSRKEPQWRWVSWGSALAALLWLVTSILFSWYAGHFGSYDKTYGSLGAAVGLMTWMWLSFVVILVGAELDAEMEHQTTRDTTTGAPKPMGSRGAKVADTVGKASS